MADLYDYLKATLAGHDEGLPISVRRMCEETGYSVATIRRQLTTLSDKGYIMIEARTDPYTGGQLPSVYKLSGLPPGNSARAELIRNVYLRYVAERTGKEVHGKSLLFDRKHFEKVAGLCEALDMDPHVYVLACFWSFPAGWCRARFKRPYPPPAIIAGKVKAKERYMTFLRQFSHEDDIPSDVQKSEIMQSIHIIGKLDLKNEPARMALFVRNGTLMPEVFMSMPSVTRDHWKLAEIDETKLSMARLKDAHAIVYATFVTRDEKALPKS